MKFHIQNTSDLELAMRGGKMRNANVRNIIHTIQYCVNDYKLKFRDFFNERTFNTNLEMVHFYTVK